MHSHIYDIAILTDLYAMIFQRNWGNYVNEMKIKIIINRILFLNRLLIVRI